MLLKDILKTENIGKHFVFTEEALAKHYCHQIVLNNGALCYISNIGTIVNPKNLRSLDLEVLLVEF